MTLFLSPGSVFWMLPLKAHVLRTWVPVWGYLEVECLVGWAKWEVLGYGGGHAVYQDTVTPSLPQSFASWFEESGFVSPCAPAVMWALL